MSIRRLLCTKNNVKYMQIELPVITYCRNQLVHHTQLQHLLIPIGNGLTIVSYDVTFVTGQYNVCDFLFKLWHIEISCCSKCCTLSQWLVMSWKIFDFHANKQIIDGTSSAPNNIILYKKNRKQKFMKRKKCFPFFSGSLFVHIPLFFWLILPGLYCETQGRYNFCISFVRIQSKTIDFTIFIVQALQSPKITKGIQLIIMQKPPQNDYKQFVWTILFS